CRSAPLGPSLLARHRLRALRQMHTCPLHLVSTQPVAERALDSSDARRRKTRLFHALPQNLAASQGESFLLGPGEDLENVVGDVRSSVQLTAFLTSLPERRAAPDAGGLFHLFATRTLRAGGEAEVGEGAADGGGLGVFQTSDR